MDHVSNNNNFLIRDASIEDINEIHELGELLNSFNLPNDRQELLHILDKSSDCFSDVFSHKNNKEFLFVLTNSNNKAIGCSQVFAKHGTFMSPHFYFQVGIEEHYSQSLQKYFRHQVLKLEQIFDGPTEVGSLVLRKDHWGSKDKLGKHLSYVRFLFMAMQPEWFGSRVIAELLPPFLPHNISPLWNAIGFKFSALSYEEADKLSRHNKEFIASLFPLGRIYVSLLPQDAQDVIGQVGQSSQKAAELLYKIGFRYSEKIDPFDGGPHFEANTSEIAIIKNSKRVKIKNKNSIAHNNFGLIAKYNPQEPAQKRFRAIFSQFGLDKEKQEVCLPEKYKKLLDIIESDEVWVSNY